MNEHEIANLKIINQQVMIDLIGNDHNEIMRFQQQFLVQAKLTTHRHIISYRATRQNKRRSTFFKNLRQSHWR